MSQTRSLSTIATGIALIVLPLVGWALKTPSTGWMVVIIIMGPIVALLLGYALQIVIAVQGFLSKRALFAPDASGAKRARIAAWLTTIAFVILAVFLPDGDDNNFGSTFQVWLGSHGPNAESVLAATNLLTAIIAVIAAVVWIGAFVWLVVEWILALRRRRSYSLAVKSSDSEFMQ